ncbi:MAG: hypothetical protein R8K50_00430, partial [Mariprofundus sp.]
MKDRIIEAVDQLTIHPFAINIAYLISFLLLIFIVSLPMELGSQALFALMVCIFAMMVKDRNHRLFSFILVALSVVVSTRYMYWRVTESISFESYGQIFFALALYLAEL